MAEDAGAVMAAPQVNLRFIYCYANDLAAMRHFYTELLGLQEQNFRDDEQWSWLVYQCAGFQFMFFLPAQPLRVAEEFSAQPGWEGGTLDRMSWSVAVPERDFANSVQRMQTADVRCAFAKPQWCQDSYWSFPVLDPMGNTVELYCEVAARPASTDWPDA